MSWTSGRVAELRRIASEGGSFSDAALALGVTRAAVAGKARREGISFSGASSYRRDQDYYFKTLRQASGARARA